MSGALYKPGWPWFEKIIHGALLACSTVLSWIRAVEEQRHYKKFYHHLSRMGKQTSVLQGEYNDWLIAYLRPIAIDRYITHGCRSEDGQHLAERVRTILATCKQQGRDVLYFLRECITASICGTKAPSLLSN